MNLRDDDLWLLQYLAEHCEAPDQSGGISFRRGWSSPEEANSEHDAAIATRLSINSHQLEALISRLEQFGFLGKIRTAGWLQVWITAAGQDAVDSLSATLSDNSGSGLWHMAAKPMPPIFDKSNVFVVYGRNSAVRDSFFAFLRAIGLHPLEWSEIVGLTGKGSPYIGEVLEAGFAVAQAVVVLMTPDDEARLREPYRGPNEPQYETELTPQPRPNVLLEAGMALGRFPDRTVIVEFGPLRPVTDLGGRHVIRMNNSAERRHEFVQRLNAAGCAISTTGSDWLKVGDLTIEQPDLPTADLVPTSDQSGVSRVLDYIDGLSPDELYRIAVALLSNNQTIHSGRNDSVAASLLHKGFLEKIPFESTLKFDEVPYLFAMPVWRALSDKKEWLLQRTMSANSGRQDRLERLQKR